MPGGWIDMGRRESTGQAHQQTARCAHAEVMCLFVFCIWHIHVKEGEDYSAVKTKQSLASPALGSEI